MNPARDRLRAEMIEVLRGIAPEIEASEIDDAQALRRQVDLDSMDWLNFLIGLNQRLGLRIEEADYARLVSLGDLLDYAQQQLAVK